MNDVIRLAIDRACINMGGNDGLFSAAGFSDAIANLAGTNSVLDGNIVRVILTGRQDIEPQKNGSHYYLKSE